MCRWGRMGHWVEKVGSSLCPPYPTYHRTIGIPIGAHTGTPNKSQFMSTSNET